MPVLFARATLKIVYIEVIRIQFYLEKQGWALRAFTMLINHLLPPCKVRNGIAMKRKK